MPSLLAAQAITGVVTTGDPPVPAEGAEVLLVSLEGKEYPPTRTDAAGRFLVNLSDTGRFALWIRMIGYRPRFTVLTLVAGDTARVQASLQPHVVEIEAVTVYGIPAVTPGQREFWSRRDKPWNISVDYREIEQLRAGTLSHLLTLLPLGRTRCAPPMIYVDGRKRSTLYLPLDWVYGVEVYRQYSDIPVKYRDGLDPRSKCGAVLIWTTELGQRK